MSMKNAGTGIESTEASGAVKWFLLIALICTIAVVPVAQCVLENSPLSKSFAAFTYDDQSSDLKALRAKESGLGYAFEVSRLINEKTMANARKFESSLEEESWLLSAAGPAIEKVLIGTLGAGSRDVYCGREGWLFFRPTIDYLTGAPFLDPAALKVRREVQPDPVKAIVDFKKQLARRGIELVVLPSPAKASIYPEYFSSRYIRTAAPLQNPSFPEFVRRLEAQGVHVFDPAPLLFEAKGKEALFLKRDTHWTPAGSEMVAQHLAVYLQEKRLLPQGAPVAYTRVASSAENRGDLAAMLKTAADYDKQRVALHQVRLADSTPWSASRNADILFLGDSYANIFSLDGMGWGTGSGLVEQLSFQLKRPVDAILINDKGSFSTRQQLSKELRRGEDRLAGKKVVVYEFAARELALGDWKMIDLAVVKRPQAPLTAAVQQAVETAKAAPNGLQLEGVIEEITRPPRPGSTAYKDAVIAMHLKQVTAGGKPFAASQIVVFAWGMRNDTVTPATRYHRGERVSLKLRPWAQVEKKYGGYQRIELQNEATMLLDIFWLAQPDDAVVPASTAAKPAAAPIPKTVPPAPPAPEPARHQEPASSPQLTAADANALFQKRVAEINAAKDEGRSVAGLDGWLFSRQELNHIAKGQFWGDAAQTTSLAGKSDSRDPLAAILDFKQQLDRAGIELIVVPVPAKAHVYPDKLVQGITPQVGRLDTAHQQFLQLLGNAGVDYLDLTKLFIDARKSGSSTLFLQKDTHWSPAGIAAVARALKEKIASRPWYQGLEKQQFTRSKENVQVTGDLAEGTNAAAETVTVSRVSPAPQPDRNSPIVLLGDSHTLIFHSGGDMHAKDAGLLDNLAFELGVRLDLIGVRGSGATPARVELARRKDNMAGKKLAIWCFTVREYTESQTGWRKVPVIRP
ncbi:alginate O-acetyltransferase AlgX-related protein [Geomonas subterranea]|uniref:AlgX/AlgJ SGNH hydrolase-like domain-containing protein n=1 Tax=Geomonas subterranea TaxID=2847989 RepID=A0ABX8LHF9_9BACT|nr:MULTISPECIES: hypothetical protein [Geomonas]QXE90904.1 hypothetical protein KP001_21435 [Geomonas subterranea]QXM11011.1 hypothetical protein KP002_07840 [Geomonas subterranea]